jgi:hypothetical protein
MSSARQNSVKQLAELYNVVVGVALTLSIYDSVDKAGVKAGEFPLKLNQIVNIATFIIILVPFYHGAMRHLFATYVEDGASSRIKNGALLADFFLLFLEGCIFVLLASVVGETEHFTIVLILLLLLDSVWGFLAWLAFTDAKAQYPEPTWALINFVTAALIGVLLTFDQDVFLTKPFLAQTGLLVIIAVRTVVDYYNSWSFYFPDKSAAGS